MCNLINKVYRHHVPKPLTSGKAQMILENIAKVKELAKKW